MRKMLTFLILIPLNLQAEIYSCNGTYTNVPCGQEVKTTSSNSSHKTQTSNILSKKKSLFHELTMKKISAEREYKLKYDLSLIEDFCFEQNSSLSDCEVRISEMQDRIDRRVASLEIIAEQKKANQLIEYQNKLEAEKQNTQVNIVQNNIPYWPRDKYYRQNYGNSGYVVERESGITVNGSGIGVGIGEKETIYLPERYGMRPNYTNEQIGKDTQRRPLPPPQYKHPHVIKEKASAPAVAAKFKTYDETQEKKNK